MRNYRVSNYHSEKLSVKEMLEMRCCLKVYCLVKYCWMRRCPSEKLLDEKTSDYQTPSLILLIGGYQEHEEPKVLLFA